MNVRSRSVLGCLLAAVAALAVAASPSAARGGCPDHRACFYKGEDYKGSQFVPLNVPQGWKNLSDFFKNSLSSWKNKMDNKPVYLANGRNGDGAQVCLQPNSSSSFLGDLNNKASSYRIGEGHTSCPN